MICSDDKTATITASWLSIFTFDFSKSFTMFEYIKDVIIVKCLIELTFLILYLTISYFLDRGTTKIPRDSCLYSDDEYYAMPSPGSEPNYINYNAEVYELRRSNNETSSSIRLCSRSPFRSAVNNSSQPVFSQNYRNNYGTESLLQRYPSAFSDALRSDENSDS
ncbi:uncharacterized protein LOC142348406 [Convolutriloba macropyga]|uniref:uncharacterized protein LOC142348406 n=1 Tax=Convolutriloba macropyga TaxID=536237 RepID=UPI003F522B94